MEQDKAGAQGRRVQDRPNGEAVARPKATHSNPLHRTQRRLSRERASAIFLGLLMLVVLAGALWFARPHNAPPLPALATAATLPQTLRGAALANTSLATLDRRLARYLEPGEPDKIGAAAQFDQQQLRQPPPGVKSAQLWGRAPLAISWLVAGQFSDYPRTTVGPDGEFYINDNVTCYAFDKEGEARLSWPQAVVTPAPGHRGYAVLDNQLIKLDSATNALSKFYAPRADMLQIEGVQPDGRLIVSRAGKTWAGRSRSFIDVLGPDGKLQLSLPTDGRHTSVVLDPAGNFYLGGQDVMHWGKESWWKFSPAGQRLQFGELSTPFLSLPVFDDSGSYALDEERPATDDPAANKVFDLVHRNPDGQELWRRQLPGGSAMDRLLLLPGGEVIAPLSSHGVCCYNSAGKLLWDTQSMGMAPGSILSNASWPGGALLIARLGWQPGMEKIHSPLLGRDWLLHVTAAGPQRLYLLPRGATNFGSNLDLTPEHILIGRMALNWPAGLPPPK